MTDQAPENPIAPGTILAGKYRVDRVLGQGGMGVVVEARHIALEERVALKFLLPEYATHPEASTRFLREARAAVKIKSEHVARVSDVGTLDTGAPYMVMEYLDGNDLRAELEKAGVLKLEDAVDYVIQGCEAIAEAHSYGIVHRDLKPANLFLTKRANGTPLVKVLDFGISKVTSGQGVDNLTKTTAAMGSALYMSPEQMQASRGVDNRTDIYALGISLYELLAGRQPFYADTLPQLCAEVFTGTPAPIRQMRPDLPETFAVVLEKAYARDRATRYQSIGEFVIALAPFAPARSRPTIESVAKLAGLEVPAPGAPPPPFVPVQGGTQIMPQAVAAPATLSGSDPSAQRVSGVPVTMGGDPPYPPAQPGAAAIPNNSASMVSVVNAPPKPSSKGPLIAVAVLGVLGIAGAGAFFGMRSTSTPTPATGTPVVTETAAPPPAATTAQVTPTPAQTASAAPTAEQTAPAASATATVAAAVPHNPGPTGAHAGAGKAHADATSNNKGQPPATGKAKPPKDVGF